MSKFITFIPRVSSNYFSEADNNGLNVLDQADFKHQILPWQYDSWYVQKALITDICCIQVHSKQSVSIPPQLYLCTREIDLLGNPTVIAGAVLNTAPYYKGAQDITGNMYVDPFDGTSTQLTTSLWSFTWSDFAMYLPNNEFYYLRLDTYDDESATTKSYYSEPIHLRYDKHPNTQLFQCKVNSNKSGNNNVVVSGWYSDVPANTIPFTPLFTARFESYIVPLDPKVVNIGYLKQLYEQIQTSGQQLPLRSLKVGELCEGIPEYGLQILTEFLMSDMLFIDKYCYIVSNPTAQSGLADLWKSQRDDNKPLVRATTVITPRFLSQQAMVTPSYTPVPPPPARLLLWQSPWMGTGSFIPYAVPTFSIDTGVLPVGSVTAGLPTGVFYIHSDETTYLSAINSTLGLPGTFVQDSDGSVYYENGPGEAAYITSPVFVLSDYYTAVFDATSAGQSKFQISGSSLTQVVDWGDFGAYDVAIAQSGTAYLTHNYTAQGTPVGANIFHNNNSSLLIFNDTLVTSGPICRLIATDGKFYSKTQYFSLTKCSIYGSDTTYLGVNIPLSTMPLVQTVLINTLNIVSFASGMFNHNFASAIYFGLFNCRFTSTVVDAIFNDIHSGTPTLHAAPASINTSSQLPPAPPTTLSATSRAAFASAGWTVITD